MHTKLRQSSEMAKFDAGMTIVALAISENDWKGSLVANKQDILLQKLRRKQCWKQLRWKSSLVQR